MIDLIILLRLGYETMLGNPGISWPEEGEAVAYQNLERARYLATSPGSIGGYTITRRGLFLVDELVKFKRDVDLS